ncbi:hypothetical protein NEIG_01590 [Nematocida sp. ERTm5]|nr:hypothetical protein NEIG_01590 [Nematocida sp. ERTm5]
MPIRNFERELNNRHLIKKYGLSILKNATIGIDGAWFVRKYTPINKTKSILMDGFCAEVISSVQSLVESMEQIGCRIVWIWNGISPKLKTRKAPEKRRKESVQNGWKYYRDNELELAAKSWNVAFDYEEVKNAINPILSQGKVEIVNAPYLAAAQGAYMEKRAYISMFFGSTDYFLFSGAEELIVDFEFTPTNEKKKVTGIQHATFSSACEEYYITRESACDIFLLLGCEYCPTIPIHSLVFKFSTIINDYKPVSVPEELLKMKESATGEKEDTIKAFVETYFEARKSIKHHPVLNEKGELVLLSEVDVPNDLNTIFGKRIADAFYSLFFRGIISLEYITGLAMGGVDVICSPAIFEAIHPLIASLYRATPLFPSGLMPLPPTSADINTECKLSSPEETFENATAPINELLNYSLKQSSDLPLVLQWLIILLDRADRSMLDKVFLFNSVHLEIENSDEIDWEVFECGESFKFALSTVKNKLKLDKPERAIDSVSINYVNGWRMEEILVLCRKKKINMLSPDQIGLIEKNLDYITKLQKFFSDNVNSTRHKRELDILVKCIKGESCPI